MSLPHAPSKPHLRAQSKSASLLPAKTTLLSILVASIGAWVLFATYSPVFTHDYVFLDDITASMCVRMEGFNNDYYAAEGRPIYGYFLRSWQFLETIRFFRGIRLYSLFSVIAFYFLLLRILRPLLSDTYSRISTAIALCLLPAVAIHILWASLFHVMTGAVFASIAAMLSLDAFKSSDDRPFIHPLIRSIGSIALIIISLMMYQPIAMVFYFVLFVHYLSQTREPPKLPTLFKHFVSCNVVYIIANAIYFTLFKLAVPPFNIVNTDDAFTTSRRDRFALVDAFSEKLDWFVFHSTRDMFKLVFIFEHGWLSTLILIFTIGATVFYLGWRLIKKTKGSRLSFNSSFLGFLIVFCLIACFHQNILIDESSANFRIATSYSMAIALLVILSILRLPELFFNASTRVRQTTATFITIGFVLYSHHNYNKYFVSNLESEVKTIGAIVDSYIQNDQRNLIVIKTDWERQPLQMFPNLEFGCFTSTPWPADALQFAAFLKTHELFYFKNLHVVRNNDPATWNAPERWPVIDLNAILVDGPAPTITYPSDEMDPEEKEG